MHTISAPDSVTPAIHRTRDLLFRPFTWGTYLKLGLVALVTEGVGANLRSSSHGSQAPGSGPMGHGPFGDGIANSPLSHLSPLQIATIVAALLLAIVVSGFVFYLITRLRFAFFYSLVYNVKQIRPGWRLYRTQAARFFWLNFIVGFCFFLLIVLVALPFVAGFWQLVHQIPPGGQPNVGFMVALVLPLIPVIFLLVLLGTLTNLILRDCMMPHFALDNATAGEAWRQALSRIAAEKLQFFVYAILRLVLPIIAMVAMFVVLLIPGLMLAGSVAAIEYGIHSTFADATGASALVGILLQVFFGLLAFGFALLVSICLGGPVSTGVREFALIFYGGRYKALGDLLYPQPPTQPS